VFKAKADISLIGTSLKTFITQQFPMNPSWRVSPSESRLDKHFTVAYMTRACSLKIEWTEFMSDHLYLNEEDKTLHVYPFKLCAFNHLKGSGASLACGPILPQGMLQETIWTLNLLFPHEDDSTNVLLKKEGQTFHYNVVPDNRKPRDLNDYEY
jgi:hypothetical protein